MVIQKFLQAVKRLRSRFDFSAAKAGEDRQKRTAKGKRPPKRKRRR